MYEWFDCHLPGCGGFTEYFLAAQPRNTLAFLQLKTVDQNAPLEAAGNGATEELPELA